MKILEHETKWHTTRLTTIEDDICTTGYLMAECNKNKVCSKDIIFLLIFWVMRDFAYSLATNRLTVFLECILFVHFAMDKPVCTMM